MSLVEAQALGTLALLLASTPWERDGLLEASRLSPHVNVGRLNREVVEADLSLNQAYWHVLALLDPLKFPKDARSFGHFYKALKPKLALEFAIAEDDAHEPARQVARFLAIEVRRQQVAARRSAISTPVKQALVDNVGGYPRCWYCGGTFPDAMIEEFCGNSRVSQQPPGPLFVDFTAPRGRAINDLRIEVDHLHPFSQGGASESENLRIACGWCNRHKSALSTLFDAQSIPKKFVHPRAGEVLVPVPFWVVRVLGTSHKCQWSGCDVSSVSAPLVVAPGNIDGAMVPGNLAVYCADHDPLADLRLVPISLVQV